MQEIFQFERHGIDEEGNVIGEIVPTGLRPNFAEKLSITGITLPSDLFERRSTALRA